MTITVALTAEQAAFVEAEVSTGRYGSAADVVREALRLLERAERQSAEADHLRRAWDAGKASGLHGAIDFDELRVEARKRLATVKTGVPGAR